MPTRSIRLSDDEAEALRELRAETGEPEAALLRRAALRGIRELRMERAIAAYLGGSGSHEAATIAGLPRAIFLDMLAERGVPILTGPSTLAEELDYLATALNRPRLAAAAAAIRSGR